MSDKELVIFDVLNTLITDKIHEVADSVKSQSDSEEVRAYIKGLQQANQIVNECIYQSKKPILDAIFSTEMQKQVVFCNPDDFGIVKSQYPSDSARVIKSDFIAKGIQYVLPSKQGGEL